MMRLQRVGRKNDPTYRLVVVDKRTGPKSNKNIDILGSYNPKLDHVQIDAERAKSWLSKGVQPSDTVHNILVKEKVIDAKKLNVLPKKSPIVDEEALTKAAEEATAKEAVEAEAPASTDSTPEEVASEPETVPSSTEEAVTNEDEKKTSASVDAEEAPEEETKNS